MATSDGFNTHPKKYGGFNIVVIMDPCPNPWWFQRVV